MRPKPVAKPVQAHGRPAYGPFAEDVGELVRMRYTKLVVHKAGMLPGDRVLDAGTGRGLLANAVARSFGKCTAVGIDLDAAHLRDARLNARLEGVAERVQFVRASADALPFKEGTFSVFVAGLAFTGTRDIRPVADEADRVLVPMSKVVIVDAARPKGPDPLSDANAERWKRLGFGRVSVQKVTVLSDGRTLKALFARKLAGDEDEEGGDEGKGGASDGES